MLLEERVIGCLKGLATGDAIGKQTETLSRADVRKWYPQGIAGFHGRPGDVIPRNALEGLALHKVDFHLTKDIRLPGSARVQLVVRSPSKGKPPCAPHACQPSAS